MPPTKVLAIILAGGSGSRMDVLTDVRAKPALPFAGVYRLIDVPLSNCVHSSIADVWVVEQFQPHSLNEHLLNGRPWDLDRTYGGLRIMPPYQGSDQSGWHQGNADALYRNSRFIRAFDPDIVVVLSADHVYKLDYRQVIDAHLERKADVTMVTTEVPRDEAGRFGVVTVDGDRVVDFSYKPDEPASDTVTTEIFVYDAGVLLRTLDELADQGEDQGALKDFGHELLPRLVADGRAFAFPLDGYWRDVGTPSAFWQAHMDLLDETPPLTLDDPAWPLRSAEVRRQAARIFKTAEIDNSLIAPGCEIRGRVVRSVLGPGVVVAEGAVVEDSIVFRDVTLEAGSSLRHAIVDSLVHVGRGATLGSRRRAKRAPLDDELVLVGRSAKIAADAQLPAGTRVEPDASAVDNASQQSESKPKRRTRG